MRKSALFSEFRSKAIAAGFEIPIKSESPPVEYVLCRKNPTWAIQVIVKGRLWAERDLLKQNIWIAFPEAENTSPRNWYIVPHGVIVAHCKIRHANTQSWKDGLYHKPRLSKDMVALYEQYKIEALCGYSPELIQLLLMQNAKKWE